MFDVNRKSTILIVSSDDVYAWENGTSISGLVKVFSFLKLEVTSLEGHSFYRKRFILLLQRKGIAYKKLIRYFYFTKINNSEENVVLRYDSQKSINSQSAKILMNNQAMIRTAVPKNGLVDDFSFNFCPSTKTLLEWTRRLNSKRVFY